MSKSIFLYCLIAFVFLLEKNSQAQHTNILISNNNSPNEPAIMINPKNTNHLIAAANINNLYYSMDGGQTWTDTTLTSTYGVWGDPCLAIDTAGNYYFFHLSNPTSGGNWIDRIVCQKSPAINGPWSNGSYTGLNGTKAQDKEWVILDPNNNNIYITWTQFDKYGSIQPTDSSVILFSKSTDLGNSWTAPVKLNKIAGDCRDDDGTMEGATPAIGTNGEIYVSWAGPNGIVFDKSIDGGNTWLNDDITVTNIPGGWNYNISGIMRCNGLPVTACDISNGPHRGTIYINWSDQRNGTADTDIWLSESSDGGNTWSSPLRVNDDPPGKQQFLTWMTIDQSTGYLYFIFYDRRNYNNDNTDVYMAISKDGGQSFINFKINDNPFLPFASIFFGDYTNITAHNGVIRPAWTAMDNGQLSIWTALMDTTALGIDNLSSVPFSIEQNYPNPFVESTYISFKIHQATAVSIKVFDLFGREITSLVNNKIYYPGKHIEKFDARNYNLAPGIYYFSLTSTDYFLTKKMLLE